MSIGRLIIASWGIAGVVALIVRALVELTPFALESIRSGQLGIWHWTLLIGWVAANAYAEGYAGFHRRFSPRTVDRALYLGSHPSWSRIVLAAPFCMGLFQASRRTRITSWSLCIGILLLVVLVRHVAQPWRGIIDAGVVVGLVVGLASLIGLFVQALVTGREPVRHEVPSPAEAYTTDRETQLHVR
jgi:hypothetical protein